jgi:[NiFe] hydrogenase diaphorase moiety small subunit
MTQTITFTLDGVEIQAKPGETILSAAEKAGIHIPRLCAYKDLHPRGSCRVCSVRCNGRIQAACVQTVAQGMVVENNTLEILEFRRAIVDMLFVEGNHFCMFCEKSGMCELQAVAYLLGIAAPQFPPLNPDRGIDMSHPDVYLDHNRCILCGRCVRVSRDLDHKSVFQFVHRGHHKRLRVNGEALATTDLRVTDAVVNSCPVGALMRKRVGYRVPIGQRRFDCKPIGTAPEPAPEPLSATAKKS